MQWSNVTLFAQNFWRNATQPKSFYLLYAIFLLLTAYAAVSSIKNHTKQNEIRKEYQAKARQSWEANPDKHPHRMAHFGTFAFRITPPLAIFDNGIENYTGNAVFLEAHRQNSVNFSEATFSTSSIRFGALSLAMLLQFVLPLILFFIGFGTIASDRQNGTLKMLLSQGATWKEILIGKIVGLFGIALVFLAPVLLIVGGAILFEESLQTPTVWSRYALTVLGYIAFLGILATITVLVSAHTLSPKNALLRLLGVWLLLVILIPKTTQALGSNLYPTPTKLAFEAAIEKDVIQKGDSHNPDDPYYNSLKDSVLAQYKVTSTDELPFNYGGFVMREGEKTSSQLYKKHHAMLVDTYQKQNSLSMLSSFINPFAAIKSWSMTMAGTDYEAYLDFQEQADRYRYDLAQTMNNLQMEYISSKAKSSEGKVNVIDHEHWEEFADFVHTPIPLSKTIQASLPSLLALLCWIILAIVGIVYTSKNAKAL